MGRGGAGAVLAMLLAAACGESSTETTQLGELRFSMSGDLTGSFEAVGFAPPYETIRGTFATGALQETRRGALLNVLAQRERQGGSAIDLLFFSVEGASRGTTSCDAEGPCPFGVAFVAGGSLRGNDAEGQFVARGGTLEVTSLDARRAAGTFDFTLEEHDAAGAPRTLRATGSFDVPLTRL